VCRAVRSALTQTYPNVEVVVVVDGPDETTVAALKSQNDVRVRIVALDENVGGSEARNIGVREAKGEYIALLDDDDEWLPEKLTKQVEIIHRSTHLDLMVACKYINRDGICDAILPSVLPRPNEELSEFLFCRCSVFGARLGFIQTSTWLIPRHVLLRVPFTLGLKVNQDTDWILRASAALKIQVVFVDEPLAIFYNEKKRARIGSDAAQGKIGWTYTFEWAMANRKLFTRKSFAFFLIIVPCSHALSQGMFRQALLRAAREIITSGQITLRLCLIIAKYAMASLLPTSGPHKWLGRAVYSFTMHKYSEP
jgi:glycosyltransferase involved in cell wall biosynthesis